MITKCLDLEEAFPKYRVRMSPEHVRGCARDPWNMEIPCRHGLIYPHGGTKLQAYCAKRLIRQKLKALPCVEVHQDGDSETTVVFEARDFPTVAALLKPWRKPPGNPNAFRSDPDNPPTFQPQDASKQKRGT